MRPRLCTEYLLMLIDLKERFTIALIIAQIDIIKISHTILRLAIIIIKIRKCTYSVSDTIVESLISIKLFKQSVN